ncbi:MAG: hypothetical protein IJ463_07910 [Bacilli bacterium]|nr:hypothetical protein [Bacilli bacterium]
MARFVAYAMKVAITNIFTIIKCSLSAFNNSLNNKYLVDSYYLILFKANVFTLV